MVVLCRLSHSLFADPGPVVIVGVAEPLFPLAHPSDAMPDVIEKARFGCNCQETKEPRRDVDMYKYIHALRVEKQRQETKEPIHVEHE